VTLTPIFNIGTLEFDISGIICPKLRLRGRCNIVNITRKDIFVEFEKEKSLKLKVKTSDANNHKHKTLV
jgi:hypothetical protein